jgi:hypothetical protein
VEDAVKAIDVACPLGMRAPYIKRVIARPEKCMLHYGPQVWNNSEGCMAKGELAYDNQINSIALAFHQRLGLVTFNYHRMAGNWQM